MQTVTRVGSLLCGIAALLALTACDNSDSRAARIEAETLEQLESRADQRTDVSRQDLREANEALAEDVAGLAEEGAEVQAANDAANAALEAQTGGEAQARANECAQLQLELDAQRRIQNDPTSERRDPAELSTLGEAIAQTEARFATSCR
jgi:hypothetical protein